MKIKLFGGIALFTLLYSANLQADEEVPCFVFSGNAEKTIRIDLSKYNRIYFNEDGFRVSSANHPDEQEVELAYRLFHHLEFKDAVPSDVTAVENSRADDDSRMLYLDDSRSLIIESKDDEEFTVGIASISGRIVFYAETRTNRPLSLESLAKGVYIAVATNGKTKQTLKFIIK